MDIKVLLVEQTVQLKASLKKITASSFFSRAWELLKSTTMDTLTTQQLTHTHSNKHLPYREQSRKSLPNAKPSKASKWKSMFSINMLLQ